MFAQPVVGVAGTASSALSYAQVLSGGSMKVCRIFQDDWANSRNNILFDALIGYIWIVQYMWPQSHKRDKQKKLHNIGTTSAQLPTTSPSRSLSPGPIGSRNLHWHQLAVSWLLKWLITSSTAQGGGGSFKNRKPIGEVGCCESGMAERSRWWTERWLRSPLFLSLSLTIYLLTYLCVYLSIYLSLSLSSVYLSSCLPVYLSIYLSVSLALSLFHFSISLAVYLSISSMSSLSLLLFDGRKTIYLAVISFLFYRLTFWLGNVLRATTACAFSTSQLPKVVRMWCVLYIFTWKCASRYNGVQFFIFSLASWLRTRRFNKPTFRPSGATNHWEKHSESRLSYLFAHLHLLASYSFSSTLLSSDLSLLSASALLCFSSVHIVGSLTSNLPLLCFVHFHFEMCFAPQRRSLFRHLKCQKWSEPLVLCTFWLGNILRATAACTFSTSQLPKVVRSWCVLYILTWKCASRHTGVHFFDISTSKSGPNPLCF